MRRRIVMTLRFTLAGLGPLALPPNDFALREPGSANA